MAARWRAAKVREAVASWPRCNLHVKHGVNGLLATDRLLLANNIVRVVKDASLLSSLRAGAAAEATTPQMGDPNGASLVYHPNPDPDSNPNCNPNIKPNHHPNPNQARCSVPSSPRTSPCAAPAVPPAGTGT